MHDQSVITHGGRGTVLGCLSAVRRADDVTAEAVRLELSSQEVGWIVFESDCPGRTRDWEEDKWYRLDGTLGVDPDVALRSPAERVRDALDAINGFERLDDVSGTDCPACGGPIEDENILPLLEAIDSDLIGVGDSALSIEALGAKADDWLPMARSFPSWSEPRRSSLVWKACGADVNVHYRERTEDRSRDDHRWRERREQLPG